MKHIIKTLSIASALTITGFAGTALASPDSLEGAKALQLDGAAVVKADRMANSGPSKRTHRGKHKRRAKILAQFDSNGDGKLTGAERTAARTSLRKMKRQKWNSLITRADLNKDGAVSKAELRKAHKAKRGNKRQMSQKRVERIFARLDVNQDGTITKAEARTAKRGKRNGNKARRGGQRIGKMFARLDLNQDGVITKAEAVKAQRARVKKMARKGNKRLNRLFKHRDSNRDGVITKAEFMAKKNKRGKRGKRGNHRRNFKGGSQA